MNVILSSSNEDYTKFIAEMLNMLENYTVKGIAIQVLTNEEVLTGYWNMSLKDKEQAKANIGYDCIDEFIRSNADRYGFYEEEIPWEDIP